MAIELRPPVQRALPNVKARLGGIYALLAVMNVGAWLWAFVAFLDKPALLGMALLVYGLGLRHAVDADHIAAIDNVTRKLMQMHQRPVSVGFFFAFGHSAIIVMVAGTVAVAATLLDRFQTFKDVGGTISTIISAVFLLSIAAMNIFIFASIYRTYRRARATGHYVEEDLDILLNGRGFLARLLRPVFKLVTRPWHMLLLGFLFGLGFDTATEVAMFGVSVQQASQGVPLISVLVFSALFAAGMSLVDTTDGVMMLGAYEWASVKPVRKLYYNMMITLVSIVVAVFVGGVEALGLASDQLSLQGKFWDVIGILHDNFNTLGFAIVGIFAVAWAVSYALYRFRRLDRMEA